jgi:hypothetical protein
MMAGVGSGLPAIFAVGGGALIGAALGRLIHQHHATVVKEQLARGGLLLWVNVRNASEEKKPWRFCAFTPLMTFISMRSPHNVLSVSPPINRIDACVCL